MTSPSPSPLFRYISHAQVVQDPEVPVPRWGLNETGRRRVEILATTPWVRSIGRLVSSDETKAVEAATILADQLGLEVEIRPASGETDRSATGYIPPARHDDLARRYFAEPERSADGWERAVDSQRRIVAALADLTAPSDGQPQDPDRPDVAAVGHGGVGTLLWCHLAGRTIDQANDQPGQGHYWTWDRDAGRMLHRWHPIDAQDPPPPLD